jgi:hypothetical protein
MFERKIINAIQKLEKEELSQLKIFINSPYFNVNGEIIRLFDIIYGAIHQNVEQISVSDDIVWKKLFSGLPFDAKKYNRLYYILGNLFDRFISQKEFEEMPYYNLKVKGDVLQNVPNRALRKKVYNETNAYIQKSQTYSSEDLVYTYFNNNRFIPLTKESNVQQDLNYYYILEKLKTYVSLLSWKKMYKLDVDFHFMDYVFEMLDDNGYIFHPSITIFKKITDTLLDENNSDNYFELRQLMKEHIEKFSEDIQREFYTLAISYCISKVNQSKTDFDKEVFELFKESVEKNILQENNELSVPVFRNIVFAALRVKEFEWTEYFINNYKKYVHPKYRDNAVYFSLARLELNRENYNKVLEYLQLINYEDVWYQLGARTMQMASYYALSEFEVLESFLDAFKMYVNREKSLTKDRKVSYINMLKFTKKLLYLQPSDKTKIHKLRIEIENTKAVASKPWLLEKVEEYNTRR